MGIKSRTSKRATSAVNHSLLHTPKSLLKNQFQVDSVMIRRWIHHFFLSDFSLIQRCVFRGASAYVETRGPPWTLLRSHHIVFRGWLGSPRDPSTSLHLPALGLQVCHSALLFHGGGAHTCVTSLYQLSHLSPRAI